MFDADSPTVGLLNVGTEEVKGLESIKEEVSGTQAYAVNSRITDAAFVGLTGQAGRHLP